MPSTINASPAKVYIMLFVLLILCYTVYIVAQSVKTNKNELEHFIEENPNYKYRLEVMKIFDMYLNRNPTPEEIDKYALIQNEQDILLKIITDFNISPLDVMQETATKALPAKVTEEYINTGADVPPIQDTPVNTKTTFSLTVDDLLAKVDDSVQSVAATKSSVDSPNDSMIVSKASYLQLKSKVTELQYVVDSLLKA